MIKLYVPLCGLSHALIPHVPDDIEVHNLNDVQCDFSACILESEIEVTIAYAKKTSTPLQKLDLLNKKYLISQFEIAGMGTLPMVEFTNVEQIDTLLGKPFILKPCIGTGSATNIPLAYKIFNSKQDFISAVAATCPNFWEQQNNPDTPILFMQESVVPSNEQELLTILTGVINGSGGIIYLPFMENFQVNGHPTDTYSKPIILADQLMLKEKVSAVLNAVGVKNSFFMMQFIRRPEEQWFPIDFQFRFSYYQLHIAPKIFPKFCKDLMRFTYDLASSVDIPIGIHSFQKLIDVNVNSHELQKVMDSCGVYSLFFSPIDAHIYRSKIIAPVIFCAYGETLADAESKLSAFETAVKDL